jgi:diacylglycerol kinase family enzyme
MKKSGKSRHSEIIPFKTAKLKLSKKLAHYDVEPVDVKNEINVSVVPKSLNILIGK